MGEKFSIIRIGGEMTENPWQTGRRYALLAFAAVIITSAVAGFMAYRDQAAIPMEDWIRGSSAMFIWALEWGGLFLVLPALLERYLMVGSDDILMAVLNFFVFAILILFGFFGLPFLTI